MSLDSTSVFGFNAGGRLPRAAVWGRTAIMARYRYFGMADQDIAVRPTRILDGDQVSLAQPIGDIASRLGPNRMRVSPPTRASCSA
jgi:hypothetical protein